MVQASRSPSDDLFNNTRGRNAEFANSRAYSRNLTCFLSASWFTLLLLIDMCLTVLSLVVINNNRHDDHNEHSKHQE